MGFVVGVIVMLVDPGDEFFDFLVGEFFDVGGVWAADVECLVGFVEVDDNGVDFGCVEGEVCADIIEEFVEAAVFVNFW